MTSSVTSCLSKLAEEEEVFDNLYNLGKCLFQSQRESLNLAIEKGKDMNEEDRLAYHAFYTEECYSLLESIRKLNASINNTKEEIENEIKARRESEGINLFIAAIDNDLINVKAIVHRGFADANWTASDNRVTALIVASYNGHLEVVRFLVNEGKANVDISNNEGFTALSYASQEGYLELIRFLINEGEANVDIPTNKGSTALILASHNGHLEIVRCLVHIGRSKIDHQTKNGNTALIAACHEGHREISSFLLAEGAAYTFKNKWVKTAGDYALCNGWNWNTMIAESNLTFFEHLFDCMINSDYSPLVEKKRGRKRKREEEEEKEKEELPFLLRFMKKVYFSDLMMSKNVFPKLSFNTGAEAGEGMQEFEEFGEEEGEEVED